MGSLSGKVAIVTGASNGIGRAIAERLAEDGAIVVVNYNHSYEKAKQVITGIQAKGGKPVAVQNAGRFMPKSLMETTEADFDQIIALNAKGPYFAMQRAANVLREGGRIVNISTGGTHLSFSGATA